MTTVQEREEREKTKRRERKIESKIYNKNKLRKDSIRRRKKNQITRV